MVVDARKVVWILGAGFSVPLGGPLFRSLISVGTLGAVNNWPDFGKQTWTDRTPHGPQSYVSRELPTLVSAQIVWMLYQEAVATEKAERVALWGDAEQFLERLEIAASEPDSQLATAVVARLDRLRRGTDGDHAT